MSILSPTSHIAKTISPVKSAQSQSRLEWIDGLRGLAVAVVIVFHAGIWGGIPNTNRLMHFLVYGRIGVDLFLVLSGFCLYWPLVKQGDGSTRPLNLKEYAHRRIRRIVPPFYAAMLLMIIASYLMYQFGGYCWWKQPFQDVFPFQGSSSIINIIAHLSLLHGFSNNYAHTIDGAYWSLSLEWQFYILLPFLVILARRKSIVLAIAIPFFVTIVFRSVLKIFTLHMLNTYIGMEICLSRWAEFASGMLAAAVVAGSVRLNKPHFLLSRIAFWVLACIVFALAHWRDSFFLLPVLWGIFLGAVVVHAGNKKGYLQTVLQWGPLVRLGTISYSLYLIHGVVFMLMALVISRVEVVPRTRETVFMFVGPPIAILISSIFFRFVEKPFMHIPKRGNAANRLVSAPPSNRRHG